VERLGLFGGSFDPVHLGHLLVAQAAREELALTRLIFIPAARSPFKPVGVPAPGVERLRLLRLALAGRNDCDVDDQEIVRGGVSYSIDTVREYGRRYPAAALYYLIGADQIPSLSNWRDASELARRVEFVVIPRPGEVEAPLPGPFRGHRLTGIPVGLSASMVRQRVRAGQPIDWLVGSSVAEAIRKNRLYLCADPGQATR
jgi:nicotinate-nucleotide adenylyltransferase